MSNIVTAANGNDGKQIDEVLSAIAVRRQRRSALTEHDVVRIANVGAESTGKTALARALAARLGDLTGLRSTWVPELLRQWCDEHQRTPRQDEQGAIADAQQRLIDTAAASHDLVVCDTTPLMTAVYSAQVFGDHRLDAPALAWQRGFDLTLLTALDLPWVADGLQRDGAHVREPVDQRIRALLIAGGLRWSVVGGCGDARLDAAVDAVSPLLRQRSPPAGGLLSRLAERDAATPERRWTCDSCDVPGCEHALLRQRAGLTGY